MESSQALKNSYSVVVGSIDEAAAISDRNAPEHLELHVKDSILFVIDARAAMRARGAVDHTTVLLGHPGCLQMTP